MTTRTIKVRQRGLGDEGDDGENYDNEAEDDEDDRNEKSKKHRNVIARGLHKVKKRAARSTSPKGRAKVSVAKGQCITHT